MLVLSLSYGIGGPIVTVAMLSLALNLALTGVFILIVRKLIDGVPESPAAEAAQRIDERRRRLKGAPLEDLADTVHEGHRF